jgi:hypothetical protein
MRSGTVILLTLAAPGDLPLSAPNPPSVTRNEQAIDVQQVQLRTTWLASILHMH